MANDHYVPRFILANWELDHEDGRKPHFWVYDKATGAARPQTAENTCCEREFYTVALPDGPERSLEKAFGDNAVEGDAARIASQVIDSAKPPSGDDLIPFAYFAALSFCRTPRARDLARLQVEGDMLHWAQGLSHRPDSFRAIADRYERDTGDSLGDREKLQRALSLVGERRQIKANEKFVQLEALKIFSSFVPYLLDCNWSVATTTPDHPFLAADVAVCVTAPDAGTGGWLINCGFGLPRVEITFPLAPHVCLVLSPARRPPSRKIGASTVNWINERHVAAASRFVISPVRSRRIEALVATVVSRMPSVPVTVEGVQVDAEEDLIIHRHVPHMLSRRAPGSPR